MQDKIKNYLTKKIFLHDPLLFFYALNHPTSKKEIKPFIHQIHLLYNAMLLRPVRFLIADEIGLGKTIESLAIARYLELKEGIKKILVLTPKILREQWESEIKRVGGIPKIIKDGNDISRIKNSFQYNYDSAVYIIISIDLAKRYVDKILQIDWDLVIVDEAHNITKNTQRGRLVEKLSEKVKNILLLSATPHRGNPQDYLYRLKMLDPTLINDFDKLNAKNFYRRTHDILVFRRTKKLVNTLENKRVFKDCQFNAVVVDISEEEKRFFDLLENTLKNILKNTKRNSPIALLAVILGKRASSSYKAAIETLNRIIKTNILKTDDIDVSEDIQNLFSLSFEEMEFEEYREISDIINNIVDKYSPYLSREQKELFENLLKTTTNIIIKKDNKIDALAKIIAEHIKNNEKIVVFTEYVDTLKYLKENLHKYLNNYGIKIDSNEILTLSGEDKNRIENITEEINRKFEDHGKILLATDVASEGLNLQIASVLINYDSPWSPIKLEQRIGRVWRLGQEKDVSIYNIFLSNRMDLELLNSLYKKIMNIKTALDNQLAIGKEIYIVNAENLFNLEEFACIKNLSEYDIIISAIMGNLNSYTEEIVKTLKIIRNKLKMMSIFPEEHAEEIKNEVLNVIQNEDYLKIEKIEEILRDYQDKVLNKNIHTQSGLYQIIKSKNDEDLQISRIVVKNPVKNREYLFFVKVLNEDDEVVWEIPLMVSRQEKNIKLVTSVELLEYLTKIFSKDLFFTEYIEKPYEKQILAIKGNILTYVRSIVSNIGKRISNYENLKDLGLKDDKLFKNLKISISDPIIIDYLPENEFSIGKIIPLEIVDTLDKDNIILPDENDLKAMDRNFLPLEELVKIEKLAMNVIMNLEEKRLASKYGYENKGKVWDVLDVSLHEHYDIKVIENGDEKYIEVKGHKGLLPIAELTEAEYRFAMENEDKYYLYIVCNLGKDEKNLIVFEIHKPLNKEHRRIYLIKNGEKIDVSKYYNNINITEKKRYLFKLA
ncbi:helicase domain-containing protein [Methanocaldococcus villosus KIN24-T80]|uniref:Helicase domain-containing protein n=1 Tax=Methanocaldococcus villosus KIN24-T80 TaxID=1069083 RepID=N6V0E7_9EURY|nr:helicase-related protein [Methanocaldococcus villosus]ENN95798.1 helicase domain-containing protein [Methanocaldococcus villosus KIN24-T80]